MSTPRTPPQQHQHNVQPRPGVPRTRGTMGRSVRYNAHIHPTARDRAIFAHLGRFAIASLAQLHARFWPVAKLRTCAERLAQLVEGGFLHTTLTTARGASEPIYWIERKAQLLFDESTRATFLTGQPAAAEIGHLLKTVDVLDRLSARYTVVDFTHEHGLKAAHARRTPHGSRPAHRPMQVADGRITLAHEGTTSSFLLEIDGAYYGQRLANKVRELSRAGESVLWVVYSARRLATLQRIATTHPTIHPVLYARL